MNNELGNALLLGTIAIGYRLLEFQFQWGDFSFFINMLLILVGVFIGLRLHYNDIEPPSYAQLLKGALRIPVLLCVIIGVFGYIYLNKIDPNYLDLIIETRLEEGRELGYGEEDIARLKNNLTAVFNPSVYSTISFFGLMLMTLIYGAISTFLFQKIRVFRQF